MAAITRRRDGSRLKVTMPVRWLHSLVTDMIPSTGSRMAMGALAPCMKSVYFAFTSWPTTHRQLDGQDDEA